MNPTSDTSETTALPQLGRYKLLQKLGQGGMGAVYLAVDTRLDRQVAVKVLPPESVNDPDAVARFRREARALAQLSHPGIVQAHDADEADGKHLLVMEYVEGVSLAALLHDRGRIPPARAADYAYQAALALHHAHEKGLVHRDVKPSNLLLTPDGRVKLLDLGLARFLQDQIADPARTREGAGMGTPDYAAPEQFQDARSADPRSDVYSLGCTLYHLLAGRVPFPGSSLSEKFEAHRHKEPPPLEELCPDVPGGLALAVQRMMAKRPQDRYQTAAQVADVLAPYVAGSSPSFSQIRTSSQWRLDAPTVRQAPAAPRRWVPWAVASISLTATLVLFLGFVAPGWFLPVPAEPVARGPVGEDGRPTAPAPARSTKPEPTKEAPRPEEAADVLTVSQKPEGGGKYRTINAALQKVQAGQTIRVLDDATYEERLRIGSETRHRGITLESTGRPTIATSQPGNMIEIQGVPGVTLRRFHLRGDGVGGMNSPITVLVAVLRGCPGVLLEDLVLEGRHSNLTNGVELGGTSKLPAGPAPVVIRACTFRSLVVGIALLGWEGSYQMPAPTGPVRIVDNVLSDIRHGGIALVGAVERVHVVGNRVWNVGDYGLQLDNLMPGARDVLIANNTIFECGVGLRLWDEKARGQNVQVRNNLFLASKLGDMIFFDSGGNQSRARGPGDGKAVGKVWKLSHNCREPPVGNDAFVAQALFPPGDQDLKPAKLETVNRDAQNLATFLRPARDSPLATQGAGKTEPSLPGYVGAMPPDGVEPWDWDRTWLAPPGKSELRTVSKKETDGAKYRTISDALKDAKPWMTVRVLDDAVYVEQIALTQQETCAGIRLEAPKGATLRMPERPAMDGLNPYLILIKGVPNVSVRHFRCQVEKNQGTGVIVTRDSPGVCLEGLTLTGRTPALTVGVSVYELPLPGQATPVVIKGCLFRGVHIGVRVSGVENDYESFSPTRRVLVRENTFEGVAQAVILLGEVQRVHVVGNRFLGLGQSGVQVEQLLGQAGDVLVANNTFFRTSHCFRVWDLKVRGERVRVSNNLLLDAPLPDMFVIDSAGHPTNAKGPGDGKSAGQNWQFDHNHRETHPPTGGAEARGWIPAGATDHVQRTIEVLSRKEGDPQYLRPARDSSLATGGAGRVDPSLPGYVGALAPEGTRPWDWEVTWRGHSFRRQK